MTEPATPTAKRLQRPSWRDSRLVVGVVLVLLATTLGAKAVAAADDRSPFYVASGDLVVGDRITETSVRRVDVRLADGVGAYLPADAPPPVGRVVVRDVRAGELVPLTSLGAAESVDVQRVTVRADALSATGLAKGDRVDVYVTPKAPVGSASSSSARGTTRVLQRAGVVAVLTDGGGFGANATTSVQVNVPAASVQELVAAVDGGAKVTLVPSAGGGGS